MLLLRNAMQHVQQELLLKKKLLFVTQRQATALNINQILHAPKHQPRTEANGTRINSYATERTLQNKHAQAVQSPE